MEKKNWPKNCHLEAKVNPSKIFDALQFLKSCGNPNYQTIQSREEYEARCMAEDPDGFDLLFGKNECEGDIPQAVFISDAAVEQIMELPQFLYVLEQHDNQREYEENYVVAKYKKNYTESRIS